MQGGAPGASGENGGPGGHGGFGRGGIAGAWGELAKAEDVRDRVNPFPGRRVAARGPSAKWFFADSWHILGPFDNTGRRNIETKFPPETVIDLNATYPGKNGVPIRWEFYQSATPNIQPRFLDGRFASAVENGGSARKTDAAHSRSTASAAVRLSQSLIETQVTPLRVRWSRPASTPPGPSSMKRSHCSRSIRCSIESDQRTVPVT